MLLASCGIDAKFHDWPSGKFYGNYQPEGPNKIKGASWSKDGEVVALVQTMGNGISVIVSPLPRLRMVDKIEITHIEAATFSKVENREITLGLDNGSILVYDVNKKRVVRTLKNLPSCVEFLDYSLDDVYLAVGCTSGQIVLYNSTRRVCATFYVPDSSDLSAMCCHPTSLEYLAGASYKGNLALWDVVTGNSVFEARNHENGVMDLDFCTTDAMVCSVGLDKKFCCYSIKSGECIFSLDLDNKLSSVAFIPQSEHVVMSSIDGKILAYDLRNMTTPIRTFIPHSSIYKIKFQPGNSDSFLVNVEEKEETSSASESDSSIRLLKYYNSMETISEDSREMDDVVAGGGDAFQLQTSTAAIEMKHPPSKTEINKDLETADVRSQTIRVSNTEDYFMMKNALMEIVNTYMDIMMDSINKEFLKMRMQLTKEIITMENRVNEKFKEIVGVVVETNSSTTQDLEKKSTKSNSFNPIDLTIHFKNDS